MVLGVFKSIYLKIGGIRQPTLSIVDKIPQEADEVVIVYNYYNY